METVKTYVNSVVKLIDDKLLSNARRRQLDMSEEKLGITTATIYILMHGKIRGYRDKLIELPTTTSYTSIPTNSAIGGSMGLCMFHSTINGDKRLLDILHLSMDIYARNTIPSANLLFIENGLWNPYKNGMLKTVLDNDAAFQSLYPNENKLPYGRFNIMRRYAKPSYASDFLRSYANDKIYNLGNEVENAYMGIYLVHTNHKKLSDSYQDCAVEVSPLDTPESTALQRNNLINKKCVEQLLQKYYEEPIRIPLPSTVKLVRSNEKYTELFLSDILKLFGKLGIQHLNIIDHSCNTVEHDIPHGLQRQLSFSDKTNYSEHTRRLGSGKRKTRKIKTLR